MAENEDKLTDEQLKARWETPEGQAFREEIIRQLQSGHAVDWESLKVAADGQEKLWKDFKGVSEVKKESEENDWSIIINGTDGPAAAKNYQWGDLRFVNFQPNEILRPNSVPGSLENTNLSYTSLQHAKLSCQNLKKATLNSAKLQHADLTNTGLNYTNLSKSKLQNAVLRHARLEAASIEYANMQNADLNYAKFRLKSFWWRIGLWRLLEKIGIDITRYRPTILKRSDLTGIKLGSSPTMHRKLLDEVFLEDFADHHRLLYYFWLCTSNCGRSPIPVVFWALLIGVFFGVVFAYYPYIGPDWTWLKDLLVIDKPMFIFSGYEWWRPYYHSFTTLTTLGWANANPNSTAGFWWHIAENFAGYLSLGYAIAVIGSLLTRRSN